MYTITCFSYKGGAGRSTSAANLAFELAKNDKKVVIIDADLTAPGLHYIFNAESECIENPDYIGSHHLVNDDVSISEIMDHYLIDVSRINHDWNLPAGSISLLATSPLKRPAYGASDDAPSTARKCIESFRDELCRQDYDYLIIDAASGLQSIAGSCMKCSDLVLVFFRWTLQHVRGTLECFSELQKITNRQFDLATVATSVPKIEELENIIDELTRLRLSDAHHTYTQLLDGLGALPVAEIPEHTPFKWSESVDFNANIYEDLAEYVRGRE